jgi:hypothetical protein
MNRNKHIWEGWTVGNFIDDLEPMFDMIMDNRSHIQPLKTKQDVEQWCKDNQPYYKKRIPDVVNYFWNKVQSKK